MKKPIIFPPIILSCILILSVMSGCKSTKTILTPATLRVVIEAGSKNETEYGTMITEEYRQAEIIDSIAKSYSATHENVEIQLELLPTDKNERKMVLQRLRTEIMSGEGPDLFILPDKAMNLSTDIYADPLFNDPNKAAKSGYFLDVRNYFDNDENVEKDRLNSKVFEGANSESSLCIIPLRYTTQLALANSEWLNSTECGNTGSAIELNTFLETINRTASPNCAVPLQSTIFNAFSQLYDYDSETVTLTNGELAETILLYKNYLSLMEDKTQYFSGAMLSSYLTTHECELNSETPVATAWLGRQLLEAVAVSEAADVDISVMPISATESVPVVNVTYWGAVSVYTEHPKEAYDFLSCFLGEDIQMNYKLFDSETDWPILYKDAAETIWNNYISNHGFSLADSTADFENIQFENFDIPDFETGNIYVRFETVSEVNLQSQIEKELHDWNSNTSATELADEVLTCLKRDLQE